MKIGNNKLTASMSKTENVIEIRNGATKVLTIKTDLSAMSELEERDVLLAIIKRINNN